MGVVSVRGVKGVVLEVVIVVFVLLSVWCVFGVRVYGVPCVCVVWHAEKPAV